MNEACFIKYAIFFVRVARTLLDLTQKDIFYTSSVKHGFILLNESGHVKYKEIVDIDVKYDVGLALATVKRIIMFKEMKGFEDLNLF